MGAEFVIAVYLPSGADGDKPKNMADVIGRSFSIMQHHAHQNWRKKGDVVLEPEVKQYAWDDFRKTPQLIAAGYEATLAAIPRIKAALAPPPLLPVEQSAAYR